MKLLGLLVLVAVAVVGVDALADLTQNRPDAVVDGTTTVVAFDVGTRDYNGTDIEAANALWAVCAATVSGTTTAPREAAAGGFEVTVSPAIGNNGHKRLVGCLEDGTLDRVQGHVASVTSMS
jgi:hypothetical protein